MTTNNLVSIIIPTHNRAELLKRAIESALNQTYSKHEIIVIDDGSTDNTKEIVDSFKNMRIKYLKNESSLGGAGTRNVGIKHSSGEFIAFLDDDDIWYNNKLELQIKKIRESEEAVLCTCGLRVLYSKSKLKYFNFPKLKDVDFNSMLFNNRVGITSTALVKKAAIDEVGPFDISLPAREEYELWIRLSKIGKLVSVNKPLLDYYIHEDQKQISANINKFIKANKLIQQKYSADYKQFSSKKISQLRADNLFQYSTIAINNRNNLKALKYITKSIFADLKLNKLILFIVYLMGFRAYIQLKKIYGLKLKKGYSVNDKF
ncbi:MAG: glycosyltransferase family 2 protein [Candidatus Delongbacteria bacterium]|jgi:glycosyltransferase involved in cell wall biosynthesis|nr:glycosyltransferase family 2 protein [Candidatus Delongbacteria bacterium]